MKSIPESLKKLKHGRKEITFFEHSGKVTGDKVWSETNVTSSGGGGTVAYGSGYVRAPTIHSSVTTNREIWIRKDDDSEFCVTNYGNNVKVNHGHDVSVVYAGFNNSGHAIAIVNRTTGYWHLLDDINNFYRKNILSWLDIVIEIMPFILIVFIAFLLRRNEHLVMVICSVILLYGIIDVIKTFSRKYKFKKTVTAVTQSLF